MELFGLRPLTTAAVSVAKRLWDWAFVVACCSLTVLSGCRSEESSRDISGTGGMDAGMDAGAMSGSGGVSGGNAGWGAAGMYGPLAYPCTTDQQCVDWLGANWYCDQDHQFGPDCMPRPTDDGGLDEDGGND